MRGFRYGKVINLITNLQFLSVPYNLPFERNKFRHLPSSSSLVTNMEFREVNKIILLTAYDDSSKVFDH